MKRERRGGDKEGERMELWLHSPTVDGLSRVRGVVGCVCVAGGGIHRPRRAAGSLASWFPRKERQDISGELRVKKWNFSSHRP